MWADQIRAGDVVRWPYPNAARSLIHEREIAAVAVQALTHDELIGAMPVISGPEAITQADQIAEIGTAIGRELRYEDMPHDEALAQLVARFGNADFARSAHLGRVRDRARGRDHHARDHRRTRPAIPRLGRRARRRLPLTATSLQVSIRSVTHRHTGPMRGLTETS
jgi:uncharacterized protein YbjT (DUF2867 family)